MTAPSLSVAELLPGCVNDGAADPGNAVRLRFFVGINVILADGSHGLLAVTPYKNTYAAAERALQEVRPDYPKAAILCAYTVFDVGDEAEAGELAQVDRQCSVERAEGVQ